MHQRGSCGRPAQPIALGPTDHVMSRLSGDEPSDAEKARLLKKAGTIANAESGPHEKTAPTRHTLQKSVYALYSELN